jgi:hypothetical protein
VPMKTRYLIGVVCALALLIAAGGAAVADDKERPDEGKVISIDKSAMSMQVQGKKNDQWTLYWTESTKLAGDLTVEELTVGDEIHFKYTDKDGKKWLTELRRKEKAEHNE